MLSEAHARLLQWIRLGSLLERTDTTGRGTAVESVMGGTVVSPSDLDMLMAQELIELLSTWNIQGYGYVRYGLTPLGLSVLHVFERDGSA
ncbi:hypothetical protein [Deinococcus koreensis]|uniref:Uncharacterized protein n=1 Tax=Deinococcus koreensis TaxID=2054903 RepID=A0A2K3V1S4_9DEIO|nr:hypothetical protein [Deinococcus koreensis]PNY82736.1 hypothetical protein CVO96_16485 [Deinococcus koreensis]